MNLLRNVDSVALFGSCVRGDHDQFSDRDVLLVGDEVPQGLVAWLRGDGYSPSVYSWRQMRALADEGSLFLQHIRQEGDVVWDRGAKLGDLLHGFRPTKSFDARLQANVELLRITAYVPRSDELVLWALDVLAVAYRNFAVLLLAQRGLYVFGVKELTERISAIFALSESESASLLQLREAKARYRSGHAVGPYDGRLLNTVRNLLARLFSVSLVENLAPVEGFFEHLISLGDQQGAWYPQIRCYEGAFRALQALQVPMDLDTTIRIESLISDPSPYAPDGKFAPAQLRSLIIRRP